MRRGAVLAHERFGEGPPIVLIHGLGHRRQAWYPVARRLAPHRDVILVDLPGHGQSPAYDGQGRPARDRFREILTDFLDSVRLDRPHIAGNSLGGLIALEAVADGHASSATALSPAGFWSDAEDFAGIERFFRSAVALSRRTTRIAPALVRTIPGRAVMYSGVAARPLRRSGSVARADLLGFLHAGTVIGELLPEAYSFDAVIPADARVTIGWGSRDWVLRQHQARRAEELLPGATHVRLPGCGHVPMSDRPGLVTKLILEGSDGPLLSTSRRRKVKQ